MNTLEKLIDFTQRLARERIHFELSSIDKGILVEVRVPGERWEVSYCADDRVSLQRFKPDCSAQLSENNLDLIFEQNAKGTDWHR